MKAKNWDLKIAICVVSILIIGLAALLFYRAVPKVQRPVDYTIYIYQNGAAQIDVDNIARVIQTESELTLGDMVLLPGTVILPGNGNPIYYNYERHDNVTQKGEE